MFKPKQKSKGFRVRAAQAWDNMFRTPSSTGQPSPWSPSETLQPPDPPSLALPLPVVTIGEPFSQPPASLPSSPRLLVPSASASNSRAPTSQPTAFLPTPTANVVSTGVWSGFHASLQDLYKSSAVFPPLQLAIGGLMSCVETIDQSVVNQKEYEALNLELKTLSQTLDRHLQTSKSAPVSEFISRTALSIQEQVDLIASRQGRTKGRLLLEAELDQQMIIKCYGHIQALFRQLQIDADLSAWSVSNEHLVNIRLEGLKPVKLATYNSSLSTEINRRMCTESTRTSVLSSLDTWSDDPNAPKVYWMNGMAGTGKTTIACTFADRLRKRKRLAASFFCTRTTAECQDVTRIITTIAYQLARYSTPFQSALCQVLGSDPDIGSCTVSTQFERLLKEPLLGVKAAIPEGLVVVIDALDECTARKGVELVLDLLFRAAVDLPLKFLVTSRPEPNIRNKIQNQPDTSRSLFVLHDVDESLVQADIERYLQEELKFPTQLQITQLAELSGRLFIYAATAVRYIQIGETSGGLEERLEIMLSVQSSSKKKYAEIDDLYTAILSAAFGNKSFEEEERKRIQLVLRTAVCVLEPVNAETLSRLTGINNTEKTIATLQPLRSVLYVSENNTIITTLHASFPDFMFDRARSSEFFCDANRHSQFLARQCFRLMAERLRFNICGLESSYIPDRDVLNLEERVAHEIGPPLVYACCYWADHLQGTSPCDELYALVGDFLSKRLLYWMEVMNLGCRMGIGVGVMVRVKLWLMANHAPPELLKFSEDAHNFTTSFAANSISQSTPHIYVSALPFCHRSSAVFEHYWRRTNGLLQLGGSRIEHRHVTMLASWNVGYKVKSVACSPNGKLVAIGCNYGSIMIKDTFDGAPIGAPLKGHSDHVTSVAFSPDSTCVVSGSEDRTLRLWSIRDGSIIGAPFEGHTGRVMSVAFSSNGTHIASGSYDKTIRIWNARNGSLVGAPLKGHDGIVRSVAFSPDGARIVSASYDKTVRIWDVQNGALIGTPFQGHTGRVRSVTFSPDGSRVASGSDDKTIRVWNVHDRAPIGITFEGHTDSIRSLAFSPDGSRIVSGSYDTTIRIWDIQSDTPLNETLKGHNDYVRSVMFSPDGTRVVSGSKDCTVRIWSLSNSVSFRAHEKGHSESVNSVAFSPDGSRIVSGSKDNTIRVWDTLASTLIGTPFEGHTDYVTSIAFSPDGSRVVSGSRDKTVRMWSVQAGTPISAPFQGHTDYVTSVVFSPDGSRVVSGSRDRTIRMWNAQDGTPVGTPFKGHSDYVRSVAFSPDGSRIASGSNDRVVRMWSVQGSAFISTPFKGHTDRVTSVAFSPDGSRVISGSDDCTIRIWDVQANTLISTSFEGHTNSVTSVAFSPDGSHIVSGSRDRTIRVWNIQDGTLVGMPLKGHSDCVRSVAFSSDGFRIVSGSRDRTIRVWGTCGGTTEIDFFSLAENGWAKMRNSQLLFWVPPDLTHGFPNPYSRWVAGPEGVIQAEFSNVTLGDSWRSCYFSV